MLANLFNKQGEVLEARFIYDRENGRSRGFGLVTYSSDEVLEDAISNLGGVGKGLSVERTWWSRAKGPRRLE